uniref:Uncharacterized protein n=1 Tax=Parascaris univalens TaxID=6257 RepID=A0A915C929_PARUN
MRYRRSLNEKTDRCEDSCIDNISLGIDEEMSTHSRSKSSDVSTNENILSTMEDPILNFAKSMAPPRSCSYSKWEKFAFYDPNEYAYRKGTQIEPDMESYLNGFRTPSLGILGTNEQFDKVTALSWMWEMCEDFVQSAPIEYFGEVFHKIEELKSLQTIKEDREEYEHWSYALSKCSIFANIHKQFRRYKSKYRGCVFSAETMISMAETEFERFESWCKRSASLKEFSRIADDDRQRALVRKDRLRKRLQKSNAEKSSIRTESGNGIDYGDNSLFLGSLGEYTLDELLRYLERDGQENKCQKKRNRRTRGKRKGSSKNEDIVGVKEERSRENVDDTSITHQHKELSSKNDEEHSLDSITDSCKIDDDGLLTEGASTDCMAKDERTQQEMSTSDSGNFNSDIVLSPRRLFSVGSEYTTTTVSTNKAEENDCCDRLIVDNASEEWHMRLCNYI